ncbi:MAG: mechanosensitive ion channel [Clostridia bacterium]|nr:mechanosensitive ion channel [Clostridia bacterium]
MLKILEEFSEYVGRDTGINKEYIHLTILTIFAVLFFDLIKLATRKIYSQLPVSDKKKYFRNRKIKISLTIICWLVVILIWKEQIKSLITLISFVSAAVTIALREIIFNFFAGIYINAKKIFEIEDRIEIKGIKGDVITMHSLGFEMLEIADGNEYEQSTGKIVHIPNSAVFSEPTKNFTKAFKYIWDEIKINIELDSDVEETKSYIYNILKNIDILKEIPEKMENQVDDVTVQYRIYYNKLEPIIYTRIDESHIELSLRYLVHPKKIRIVQNEIYLKVLEEYNKGNIKLYKE